MHQTKIQLKTLDTIEDALANIADSDDMIGPVLTRMVQRARTEEEAIDIQVLLKLRRKLRIIKTKISELHTHARPDSAD